MREVFCIVACLLHLLTADGDYSEWGSWGECSVPCGTGKQMRMRKYNNPVPHHGDITFSILKPANELRTCHTVCPPVNGGYSMWGPWTECSATCGGGVRTRLRSCTKPTPGTGGKNCSKLGLSLEVLRCNETFCIGREN